MSLIATCHCGGTRITLPDLPSDIRECNCTYCHRTGAIWGYYSPDEVQVDVAEHDAIYAPNGMNVHHFCGRCGGNTHGSAPDWASVDDSESATAEGIPSARRFSANLRMVSDLDLSSLNIVKVNGLTDW